MEKFESKKKGSDSQVKTNSAPVKKQEEPQPQSNDRLATLNIPEEKQVILTQMKHLLSDPKFNTEFPCVALFALNGAGGHILDHEALLHFLNVSPSDKFYDDNFNEYTNSILARVGKGKEIKNDDFKNISDEELKDCLYAVQKKLKNGELITDIEVKVFKKGLANALGINLKDFFIAVHSKENKDPYHPSYSSKEGTFHWIGAVSADKKTVYFISDNGQLAKSEVPGGVQVWGFLGKEQEPIFIGKNKEGKLIAQVGNHDWDVEKTDGPSIKYLLKEKDYSDRKLTIEVLKDGKYKVTYQKNDGTSIDDPWAVFPDLPK